MTLTPDSLNETDEKILAELRAGRVTPGYLAEELDISRPYASERLKRLFEHKHIERPASGLYELVDDPGGTQPTESYEDAIAEKELAEQEVERLREELREARETSDLSGLEDVKAYLDRALEEQPEGTPGRTAIEDARAALGGITEDE